MPWNNQSGGNGQSPRGPWSRGPSGRMQPPDFPTPIGVFHAVERPTYDAGMTEQIARAQARGAADLDALFNRGDTWDVT